MSFLDKKQGFLSFLKSTKYKLKKMKSKKSKKSSNIKKNFLAFFIPKTTQKPRLKPRLKPISKPKTNLQLNNNQENKLTKFKSKSKKISTNKSISKSKKISINKSISKRKSISKKINEKKQIIDISIPINDPVLPVLKVNIPKKVEEPYGKVPNLRRTPMGAS